MARARLAQQIERTVFADTGAGRGGVISSEGGPPAAARGQTGTTDQAEAAAVRDLCRGRNTKAIRKHREDVLKNQHRMAYAQLIARKLPIGSGAIASAVRRGVHVRLQGSSLDRKSTRLNSSH